MQLHTHRALALAACVLATPVAAQDFTSPEAPQVVGLAGWTTSPVWTVGESIDGYVPPGIPDGTGAVALDDNQTVRIFVNHELTDGVGYAYSLANGTSLRGARVSYFDVDKTTRALRGSGLAYDTIIDRFGDVVTAASQIHEGQIGSSDDPLTTGIDRLCSANFFNAGEYGLVDPMFFTGEETGNGQEFTLDIQTNTLYTLPWLGRAAWESVTLLETGDDDTIAVLIGDDRGGAPLLLYVGTKQAGGDFVERNGLANGTLHAWVADSGETTPEQWNGTGTARTGRFVAIAHYEASKAGADGYDAAGFADMDTQDAMVAAIGGFQFSRPEDVSTNPADGTQAVMASTGRSSLFPSDSWGTTYLVDVDFEDSAGGVAAELTVLYDGDDAGDGAYAGPDFGLRSPDNLDWADDGLIYLQEDRSVAGFGDASGKDASIFQLDPSTPTVFTAADMVRVAQIDGRAVPDGQRDNEFQPNESLGVRETSGILDVTSLFDTASDERLLIVDVQAHEARIGPISDGDLVQGGQLLFLSRVDSQVLNAQRPVAAPTADDLNLAGTDATYGEFVAFNSDDGDVSLAGGTFLVFDPFTEQVTYVQPLQDAIDAENGFVLATTNGDETLPAGSLPNGPGAIALVAGSAEVGDDVATVLAGAEIVAAVVYGGGGDIFASIGGGASPAANAAALADGLARIAAAVSAEEDPQPSLDVVAAPNPVSGLGTLSFGLAQAGNATVGIYDVLGRQVVVVADGAFAAGRHAVTFDARSLPAGTYVVRVVSGEIVQTARMTVVR